MNASSVASRWAGLRSELQVNTRLRVGLLAVLGIVWLYGLLVAGDAVQSARAGSDAVAAEIERLRPLSRDNPWPARADDARQQLAVLRGMQWADGAGNALGLTEAALQDWVRSTAAKAGLRVRELSLSRTVSDAAADGGSGAASAAPAAGQAVKLRLTADWGRAELVAFLAEVGRSERVIVVERLHMRPAATPASVEIDLRVWVGVADATAATTAPTAGLAR